MSQLSLNGSWSLYRIDAPADLIPATVPGCVHTDLLAAGRIEDPYYRDNEKHLQWISRVDWVYTRVFDVPADLLAHDRVLLRCHGLDTIAALTLNGVEIGHAENMYRTWEFDAKPHLRAGENTLAIRFTAPVPYVERMDAERGVQPGWVEPMRINSSAWIRKEPCNFGWDWGPVLVTSGIWRSIELVAFDAARLTDVHIAQDHAEAPERVTLTVEGAVAQVRGGAVTASIEIARDGVPVISAQGVPVKEGAFRADLTVERPALWWVNGLGDQPLYTVTVKLHVEDDAALDSWERRIGLRVLKLERHEDEWGESFYFTINGVPFFAKGANWIPADPFAARVTPEFTRKLIGDAHAVNMNMLRVWGGGIYEEDVFYDLCDQYGIAIWQDFMFACGTYPAHDDDFVANVRAEAIDNVRRIRHHACLALWCGNNEIESGMKSSGWNQSMGWDNYSKLFDHLLGGVVKELDPQRDYWPSSPHSPHGDREDHNNPKWGDAHLWDVWHGRKPFEWYHTRPDRFVSEFGFQSFPSPQTIAEFTAPEDRNITSYVMEHHQRSAIGNATIVTYMLDWFRLPNSFESTVWLSQILQGLAMQYAVEGWRRNMPQSMGALYWQLNDCWPAPTWASIDYKGNWKATQYMARRFFAPLLISGVEDVKAGTVAVYVTNDETKPVDALVRWSILTPQGETLRSGEQPVTAAPLASTQGMTLDCSDLIAEYTSRGLLAWLELAVADVVVSNDLVTFSRPKHIELVKPAITTTVKPIDDREYEIVVRTDQPALFIWLELDGLTGQFEDNFFHLMPGHAQIFTVTCDTPTDAEAVRRALRVRSLGDTY